MILWYNITPRRKEVHRYGMVAVNFMGVNFARSFGHRHCGDDDGATPKLHPFWGGNTVFCGGLGCFN